MTPETSMRRPSLITELLSVSEASSSPVRSTPTRPRCALLLLGAVLLTSGCPSSNSLTRVFGPPKQDKDQSLLSALDKDRDEAGLPPSSKAKSKPKAESLTVLLDRGEDALSTYYQDASPAHLTEAHRCYEQALAQDPGNPESHHGLAIICDLQKDYASAELHYRAALEHDPDNGTVLGDLGYSFLLQNRLSESERILLQATKLDPGNTGAVKNLACVYAKQGNYNLADSTFRRVLNDLEVRQEMAQLFPSGRPDMAREGENSKRPWQRDDGITSDQLAQRMTAARDQSSTEMRDRRTALEAVSPPARTIEQQQAMIAQLAWERDEALRQVEARSQQSSNTPLVLDDPSGPRGGAVPGISIQPQSGPRPTNTSDGQYVGAPSTNSGRRVQNGFYPNNSLPQFNPNPNGIQQAGSRTSPVGPNGQPIDQALHQTHRGIDPRTGRPWNSQVEQMDGQQSLVPGGLSNPDPGATDQGAATSGRAATFEEAKRRAAMAGLGGPELMFPLSTPEGGNRMAPGSGSTFNGGQYPQPPRMLPMNAAPHDLRQLLDAPSGEMTVQPNNLGQLNSPAGRSFSNPNFQQPLSPQIPLDSPLGNQGMNYQDQAYSAQHPGQQQPRQAPQYEQYDQYQSQPNGDMTSAPRSQGESDPYYDSRNRINADLNQYGQSFQHNPAQYNSNSWNQTPTPANGLPNQPRAENPSQLMTPSWNPQQYAPRVTPLPYPGRPTATAGEDQNSTLYGYGTPYRDSYTPGSGYEPAGGMSSEPAPIYSPGVQVPAPYNGGNRSAYSDGQSYYGPRITPARR